ncbi:MAG: AAA family ATPase [Desulfobacterium sp.]|nr:AAA family ATPase [Desulfobacterium sp.]
MMERPYTSFKIEALETLAKGNWHDSEVLSIINRELGFRKTRRAMELKERISKELLKRETGGNSDDLVGNFIKALSIEIQAAQKQSFTSTVDLRNGERVESGSEGHIYAFPNPDGLSLRDDTPVVLVTGGQEKDGTLVSVSDERILVLLAEDLGESLAFVKLRTDTTFLLKRLKERLQTLGRGEGKFNLSMIRKGMGMAPSTSLPSGVNIKNGELNKAQLQAVEAACNRDFTFLWGPPGTGKTATMARVVETYYRAGMRVLLVSNTNLAVDVLLEKLCERLKGSCEAFEKGAVLRFGRMVKEELKERFGAYVDVGLAVERLSKPLKKERSDLQQDIERLDKEHENNRLLMAKWEEREVLKRKDSQIRTDLLVIHDKMCSIDQDLLGGKARLSALHDEFEKAKSAGMLRRLFTGLNPEKIKRRIADQELQNESAARTILEIQGRQKNLLVKARELVRQIKAMNRSLDKVQLHVLKRKMEVYPEKRVALKRRIQEIHNELGQIREEVLKSCRVVAATATQTFLKPGSFKSFDAVVVDEASMLILPAVGYVLGLAKKRAVVAGDFRQLPPIVVSKKDDTVKEWVGQDIFSKAGIDEAVGRGTPPVELVQLTRQYRMEEKICDLINLLFYDGSLETDPCAGSRKGALGYPDFLDSPLTLVNTSAQYPFANIKPGTYSRYNVLHAVGVRNLCCYLKEKGYVSGMEDFGVITPYSAQADFLASLVKEKGVEGVTCGTVHRFQGNEKDIILFDTTDGYGMWNPGIFLKSGHLKEDGAKLLNVALSRARSRLVVFANCDYLKAKLPQGAFLRKVMGFMEEQGRVIPLESILSLGPNDLGDIAIPGMEGFSFDPSKTGLFDETTFDRAFLHDLGNARKTVVIFSGFCTPARVGVWADMFRQKLNQGVRIRIVTRPPQNQGTIRVESVNEALHFLDKLGVVVDLRYSIHEKICFIDDEVLWHGSLNPLSHTGRTDESMMRIKSREACRITAEHSLYRNRPGKKNSEDLMDLLVARENPVCQSCGSPTVFHVRGKHGPYFNCLLNCGWSVDLKRAGKPAPKGGVVQVPGTPASGKTCPKCGCPMVVRNGKFGQFWGCKGYPECKNTEKLKMESDITCTHPL